MAERSILPGEAHADRAFCARTFKEGVSCLLMTLTAACSPGEQHRSGGRATPVAAPRARVSSPCRRHASTRSITKGTTSVPTDIRGARDPKRYAVRVARRTMAGRANWTNCISLSRSPTSTAAMAKHISGPSDGTHSYRSHRPRIPDPTFSWAVGPSAEQQRIRLRAIKIDFGRNHGFLS